MELGFLHLIFNLSLIIQILEVIIHHIPDKRIKVSISIQQQLDFFYSVCIYYPSICSVPPFSILDKDKSPGQNQQNGIYPSCWFSSIDFTDFCFEAKNTYLLMLYGS